MGSLPYKLQSPTVSPEQKQSQICFNTSTDTKQSKTEPESHWINPQTYETLTNTGYPLIVPDRRSRSGRKPIIFNEKRERVFRQIDEQLELRVDGVDLLYLLLGIGTIAPSFTVVNTLRNS